MSTFESRKSKIVAEFECLPLTEQRDMLSLLVQKLDLPLVTVKGDADFDVYVATHTTYGSEDEDGIEENEMVCIEYQVPCEQIRTLVGKKLYESRQFWFEAQIGLGGFVCTAKLNDNATLLVGKAADYVHEFEETKKSFDGCSIILFVRGRRMKGESQQFYLKNEKTWTP